MRHNLLIILVFIYSISFGQSTTFESDPGKALFVTNDIISFWEAYDSFALKGGNPFQNYLDNGSQGLRDFIPYRIENANKLRKTVKKRMGDYEKIRELSMKVKPTIPTIRNYYQNLKYIYPSAVFPPTYFVIGRFNSGGTSSSNGLIIGVEMQQSAEDIPYIVAHELIHFNQKRPSGKPTLLEQSIIEGSADFIGELISGKHINEAANAYGDANEDELCAEFVNLMFDKVYHGWLYGSSGKKEGRPNDLGYWVGYKICKAYYDKAANKEAAVSDILNIEDFRLFLDESGYLNQYL